MNLDGLERHAECGQREDGNEQHLARVPMQKTAQLTQLFLEPGSEPDGRPLAFRLALKSKQLISVDVGLVQFSIVHSDSAGLVN